jgi:predicted trehalose synthase
VSVVAEIHRTTLEPTKLDLLTAWLPQQRWYAAKGRTPVLRKLGGFRLDDPAGDVGIEVMVVADESGVEPVVYQVPMTYRAEPLAGADGSLIGTTEHGVLGRRWVYDAPHDDVFVGQLLALIQGQAEPQAQSESHTPDPTVEGHAVDPGVVTLASSAVLRGEQSNTSVVCQVHAASGEPAPPVIIKVFRALHPGENPDVVVQSALTEAGSTQVPHTVGYVAGEWADPRSGDRVRGHLAFAQRFLPGVEDAWRVALRAATAGEDFTEPARELGASTAHIHLSLAAALGTVPAEDAAKRELVRIIRSRYDAAVAEVPSLAAHEAVVAASLDDLAARDWPDLQRVHGDYHLGQVLRTPDGWVAVDFEGEPLRPLHERVRPDLALRDVAGMLRSFDYVGGSVELAEPDRSARDWVAASRAAFLEGYTGVTHLDPATTGPVLRALELDKALYEVIYEVRNRPTWLGIPTAAIERLVSDTSTDTSTDTSSDTSVQQGAVARKGPS